MAYTIPIKKIFAYSYDISKKKAIKSSYPLDAFTRH